jgi:hypothetical protein
MENLQASLMEVERQLEALDGVFETRLQRATVMLQNAFSDGKQIAARIRAATQSIQAAEHYSSGPNLLVMEGEAEPELSAQAAGGPPQA